MTQSIPIESLQQTFAAQTFRHCQPVVIWHNYSFPFVDISFRHLFIITRIFTTAMMALWPGKGCKPEQAKGDIFKSHHQVTLTFGVLAGVLAACCIVYRDLEKDCKSKSCKSRGGISESHQPYLSRLLFAVDPHLLLWWHHHPGHRKTLRITLSNLNLNFERNNAQWYGHFQSKKRQNLQMYKKCKCVNNSLIICMKGGPLYLVYPP